MRAELFQIVLVLLLLAHKLLMERLAKMVQALRQTVADPLNMLLLLLVMVSERLILLLVNLPGLARLFGKLLMLSRQLAEARRHLLKGSLGGSLVLARLFQHVLHQLRQALVVFHDLQLLSRDACQVELAYFAGDGSSWVNDGPNIADVAHANQACAWGNADRLFFDGEPARGDPPPRHRLTGSRDPGGLGQTDPGIVGASQFLYISDQVVFACLLLHLACVLGSCAHLLPPVRVEPAQPRSVRLASHLQYIVDGTKSQYRQWTHSYIFLPILTVSTVNFDTSCKQYDRLS